MAQAGVAIDQNGLDDLIQALRDSAQARDGTKVPIFKSTNGEHFLSWRGAFELIAAKRRWSNSEARRQMRVAIEGDACLKIRGIPLEIPDDPNVDAVDYHDLLDRYQTKFIGPGDEWPSG